ncbi:sigma-70 family RNA polymerase sigma factor [Pseudomonas sp. 21LCFQ02]|uniref:sigma-70 family RNA polymerase sigma factor n=1 Tax=unclassified Pseudomonas TaxID=196821 RepID=UPI0004F74FAA|nr:MULTISPECIES: sigma-70 family RNA polymerase sigma factor [unclassified Pseudomonas]MCO8169875.1 sigma-70 family RNA polymerase sigma factor [Pseudomonas sp. 21LCFQ02]MCQ9422230.1 sigma-70 family RNA polymerase sigma factor [Pseudomonas sp. LJDD11]BAP45850.1 sigma factor [Pseudomonas sp. StFLB209]
MADSAKDLDALLALRRELVNYANGITGDRMQAEDIVQEAYVRLIAGQGEPIEQPAAYAYRVVRNLALDLIRSRAREQARHASPPDWLLPAVLSDPADTWQHGMALERLASVLDSMPVANRRALEMHRFGGYTLAQIAEQLGVSVTSAHRLLRDALVRLTRAFVQECDDQALHGGKHER